MNKNVSVIDIGRQDFKSVWDYQEILLAENIDIKIANKRKGLNQMTKNHLIIVEHPHVYTLGKSGDPNNLLLSESQLRDKNIDYYPINRGGDITYHGPGQLVMYPIFDLENFEADLGKYLRNLEEAVILTLRDYGLKSGRIDGLTGVWLDFQSGAGNPRKICAIGIKSSRWVTMHGLAFNINTDLRLFENIIPCGIDDKAVTSLEKELGKQQDLGDVKEKMTNYLSELFGFEYDKIEKPDFSQIALNETGAKHS